MHSRNGCFNTRESSQGTPHQEQELNRKTVGRWMSTSGLQAQCLTVDANAAHSRSQLPVEPPA